MKNELIKMLLLKSFKYSDKPIYKLVSGRMSHFYVDCKPTILDPYGMAIVGELVYKCIKDRNVKGVGGLTFGADPIAISTAFTSRIYINQAIRFPTIEPIQAFSIRKIPKEHGTCKWIEGNVKNGDKVAIVDDVVTTGGSTIKAIERAREEGLEVVKVVVLVDREEDNGIEKIKEYCDDVTSIVTIHDLMEFN